MVKHYYWSEIKLHARTLWVTQHIGSIDLVQATANHGCSHGSNAISDCMISTFRQHANNIISYRLLIGHCLARYTRSQVTDHTEHSDTAPGTGKYYIRVLVSRPSGMH